MNIERLVDETGSRREAPTRQRAKQEHFEISGDNHVAIAQMRRPSRQIDALPQHHRYALAEIRIEGSAQIDGGDIFDEVDRRRAAVKADWHNFVAKSRQHAQSLGDRGVIEIVDEIRRSQFD